jgi:glyoxylate/hydroxypyruvate reductase A
MLNRDTLDNLPNGAYLINVARGAQVVEEDLLAMLRSGDLAGAMLDVFQTEPLPPGHPFWQQSNLTITPHIAALTVHEEGNAQVTQKLRRVEQGLPVTGVINRQLGY